MDLIVLSNTTKLCTRRGHCYVTFLFQLEVFQPFFVSLNLPPSVTRGEQFILEVNIFNYLKEVAEVKILNLYLFPICFVIVMSLLLSTVV